MGGEGSILVQQDLKLRAGVYAVPLVDLTANLRARGKELYLDADPVHYNAQGNAIIADRIFEALTAKGGVLVAIRSEPRAADALAILHSYGGGNAAIGAWTGRV